tara:strand:+ start:1455 stop:2024 length:570 start_codon:yes stop_codon:yes gene_type:complete
MNATAFNLDNAVRIYEETIAPLHARYLAEDNAGGKMRASMGDLYEDVAQAVIYAVDPSIVCKHNDYIMIESRGGKSYKKTQVDIHAYKDGELIFIVEGKTYLDSSMLDRACSEFDKIRRVYPGIPAAVFTGQDATDPDSAAWFADETEHQVFVVNSTKQRRSTAPIFETADPLDMMALQAFARWVDSCL